MAYMLKVSVFEEQWKKNLCDIIDLCKRSDIREVFLMEQYHGILLIPFTIDKHKRMAEIFCRMAEELRREGIIFSVNIGAIVGHMNNYAGKELILPFRKFVGDELREADECCCILDESWQEYAAQVCSLYAMGKPDKIFIDDDFRSVNHTAAFGCFCPLHIKRTSEEAGMDLTADSLLSHIRGSSSEDMKVRKAWMKITFEGQLEAAKKMRTAVEKISPGTRIGLMNSGEEQHSVQGRDMDRLLREFSGNCRRPLSRPAGGGYVDILHADVFQMHQRMALSMSVLGKDVQIASEADCWPYSRFNKSIRIAKSQLQIHALAGADDFTVNINDYLTIPVEQEPDICDLLVSEKERLSIIQKARMGKKAKGLGLPWKKDTASVLVCRNGSISGIMPDRNIDCILAQFGIPTQFDAGRGNLILGDAVNCYDDSEIKSLLSGGLMIDGLALEQLCKRGFKRLLGCYPEGYVKGPCVEKLDDNEFSGRFAGSMAAISYYTEAENGRYIYNLSMQQGAISISAICNEELKKIAPGVVLYENELGGRIAAFAAPLGNRRWLFRSRAYQMAKIADWIMYGQLPVWIEDCPNIGPFYYEDEKTGEGLLGVASGTPDPVEMKIHTGLEMVDLFTGDKDYDQTIEPLSVRFFRTMRKQ